MLPNGDCCRVYEEETMGYITSKIGAREGYTWI